MTTTSTGTNYSEPVVDTAAPKSTGHEETGAAPEAVARGGLWEWLTRRHALRIARRAQLESQPEVRELTERARETALVADRLFDALEPVSSATGQALAADLYRQSVLWSLSARAPEELRDAAPEVLWDATDAAGLLVLPESPRERAELERFVLQADFRGGASLPDAERQKLANQLRTLAQSAIELGSPGSRAVRALLFQRFVRLFAACLLVASVAALGVLAAVYAGQKPNLAAGKPWRASSTWAVCKPEIRTCGVLRSGIFFHTLEDPQPWVEFDLSTPTSFSEVYVRNRTDSVPDRAIPLVIEVSDDAKTWRPVARRDDSFRTWTASFPSVTARYVRLRVDRRSYLHLEAVEIHA
jgi:F5/8 type C domain-containing protein